MSISRSSAFVTMATGSPVLGSLRTLRNIDDNATLEVPNRASSGTDSYHAHLVIFDVFIAETSCNVLDVCLGIGELSFQD